MDAWIWVLIFRKCCKDAKHSLWCSAVAKPHQTLYTVNPKPKPKTHPTLKRNNWPGRRCKDGFEGARFGIRSIANDIHRGNSSRPRANRRGHLRCKHRMYADKCIDLAAVPILGYASQIPGRASSNSLIG